MSVFDNISQYIHLNPYKIYKEYSLHEYPMVSKYDFI